MIVALGFAKLGRKAWWLLLGMPLALYVPSAFGFFYQKVTGKGRAAARFRR